MKSPRKIALWSLVVIVLLAVVGGVFALNIKRSQANHPRIVATTFAIVQIADKLNLDLAGVPTTQNKMPARYKNTPRVGSPMSPSYEKISQLHPTAVYSVDILSDQFGKAFKAQNIKPHFLKLNNVAELQSVVTQFGKTYNRQKQAQAANNQINQTKAQIQKIARKHHRKPRVLVLMGLPGAGYMIATNLSYVGDLVRLAGGNNVYTSSSQVYMEPNDESIKAKQPQVILRLAHALPGMVIPQFNQEFKSDPMWKTIPAVKNHRVYNLTEPNFDATANMKVSTALKIVSNWLYPTNGGNQ